MMPLSPPSAVARRFLLATSGGRTGNLTVEVELATTQDDPDHPLQMTGVMRSSPVRWYTWLLSITAVVLGIVVAVLGQPTALLATAGGAFLGLTTLISAIHYSGDLLADLTSAMDGTVELSARPTARSSR